MGKDQRIHFIWIHKRHNFSYHLIHVSIGALQLESRFGAVRILHRGTRNVLLVHEHHHVPDPDYVSKYSDGVIDFLSIVVSFKFWQKVTAGLDITDEFVQIIKTATTDALEI